MALSLPSDGATIVVSGYQAGRVINGRSIKRNSCGCCGVEIWRRMHLHHLDLYYRVLGAGLCELLTRIIRIFEADLRGLIRVNPVLKDP
jgi:hypothetical protein